MAQMALHAQVGRARSYWRAVLAGEGLFWTLSASLLAFVLGFHLDRLLVFSRETRVIVWGVLGAIFLIGLATQVLRPLFRRMPDEQVAAIVEQRYPELRERLLSAVEFNNATPEELRYYSPALLQDLQVEARQVAGSLNFRRAFKLLGVMRAGTVLGMVLLFTLLHMVFAGPAFGRYLSRMALSNAPVWRDTRVQVSPLRGKILRGTDLTVGIRQEGHLNDRARLSYRIGDGHWTTVELHADKNRHFAYHFAQLTEPVQYYATSGDGISDRGRSDVVDAAVIVGAKLTLTYPDYMDRKPETVNAEGGGVAAPVGTRADMELRANKPLAEAEATLPKAKPAAWPIQNDRVTGSLTVKDNGQYTLRLKDQDGFTAPEPQSFPIKAIPDQTPEVTLADPAGDLDVVPDAKVRLVLSAKDDYGINEIRVPYEVESRKAVLPAGHGGKHEKVVDLENVWNLSALNLKPGDTVRYRIEATDFDNISGPHVGKTADLQLRIIDKGEAQRKYEDERNEVLQQFSELIKEQKAARADVEAQRNAAKPNSDAIAAAEERQRSAANSASDLARRVGELNRNAETNNLASQQETQAQKATQKGLDDLSKGAMPQAANKIGTAQPQAQSNPSGAKSDLGQASQQQQQIVSELQKLAEAMKPGSELERLAQRFDRLAQEQRKIQAQTDKMLPQTLGKPMSELSPQQRAQLNQNAQSQQSLQKATAQAMADLDRTANGMQSRNPDQAQAANQTSQDLKAGQVGEQQSQASQNVQQNALGQARGQQENAARQLENAAEQLRQAQNPNDPRALERQLQRAANQLSKMLQRQQEAIQQTQSAMTPQQQQELAKQQREMQKQAEALARQLERLQRRTPSAGQASKQLDQAGQKLDQSSQSLNKGQQQQAQGQQQQAMQNMQRAMQSLQQAMAEAKQESDPFAALRTALQKLAQQQRTLVAATRRIDEEQQTRGAKPDDAAELQRLAQKQSEVEAEASKLEPDLPGEVFKNFSQQARKSMTRAKDGLQGGNPKANPTQQAQQRAITVLDQLARALDPDPNDNSQQQGGGGGGDGGGGGGGGGDPELPKRIAEIRLLRFMEQAIKGQTQDVDDNRRDPNPLTEAQKAQVDDAARQQADAKDLAGRVAKALARYRSLAGKVDAAGKHMNEAKRGLDRADTGDPVLEQEQQAIIQLSEALKSAQQQQQQQQQSQRQRQQQRQAQQRGQQNGQPQGGTEQQQQGGNQPAMESKQRHVGAQAGDLSGILGTAAHGFNGLDPREQDALRQSYKEKTPAEYQDLVARYYKALTNKAR